jgi:hypothetical protein
VEELQEDGKKLKGENDRLRSERNQWREEAKDLKVERDAARGDVVVARERILLLEKNLGDAWQKARAVEQSRLDDEVSAWVEAEHARQKAKRAKRSERAVLEVAREEIWAKDESLQAVRAELVDADYAIDENEYLFDLWRPQIYQYGYSVCRDLFASGYRLEEVPDAVEVPAGWWGDRREEDESMPFRGMPPPLSEVRARQAAELEQDAAIPSLSQDLNVEPTDLPSREASPVAAEPRESTPAAE